MRRSLHEGPFASAVAKLPTASSSRVLFGIGGLVALTVGRIGKTASGWLFAPALGAALGHMGTPRLTASLL